MKYNTFYFIIYLIPFFLQLTYSQTPEWILTSDGSKNAFSSKEVLFGVKKVEINIKLLFMPQRSFLCPKGQSLAKK